MKIGIDIDNTIVDTFDKLYPYFIQFKKDNNINTNINKNAKTFYEYMGLSAKQYDEFASKYFEIVSYKLELMEYAKEILQKLARDHELIFITARSEKYYSEPYTTTRCFLVYNNIPFKKIIINAIDKGIIAKENNIDLFIDDNVYNCESVYNNEIDVILFDSVINRGYFEFQRAKNWRQIDKMVQKKEKQWKKES